VKAIREGGGRRLVNDLKRLRQQPSTKEGDLNEEGKIRRK
jgi:hypothetical protein